MVRIVDADVCKHCLDEFQWIKQVVCPGCGQSQSTNKLCIKCVAWQKQTGFVIKNRALLSYNEAMQNYMKQYKFTGDYRLRRVFSHSMKQLIEQQKVEVVVPIPVEASTWHERGFNQVTGIIDGVNYLEALTTVQQVKSTKQSHKNRQERLATPQPFALTNDEQLLRQLRGKRVGLVDDVYTTGRTIYHAAALIQTLGPASVVSVTLAR